jgi:hypothetical protein
MGINKARTRVLYIHEDALMPEEGKTPTHTSTINSEEAAESQTISNPTNTITLLASFTKKNQTGTMCSNKNKKLMNYRGVPYTPTVPANTTH